MEINIKQSSSVPIYIQIRNQIRDMILKQEIPDGFVLPSERTLARKTGVHRNTVNKAYHELRADGLIESYQGLCHSVSYSEKKQSFETETGNNTRTRQSLPIHWEAMIKEEFLNLETTFDLLFSKSYVPGNISFAGGIAPPEAYGKDDLRRILSEILDENSDIIYEYTPYQGLYSLRRNLCDFLSGKGIQARPEELQVLPESNQALSYLVELLIKPGDAVFSEEPVSPDVYREFALAGARLITVPMDEEGMICSGLDALIEKHHPKFIYVNPGFHDPTGITMTLKRRKQLLDLSYRHRLPIIEMDEASEIIFEGSAVPSLKSLDAGENVIYIYSFALTFAPGLGLAFLAGPKPLMNSLRHLVSLRLISLDSLSQQLLNRYLQEGIYMRNLKNLCAFYKQKLDLMCDMLEDAVKEGLGFQKPGGGVYLWCRLPETVHFNNFVERSGREGVSFIPGNIFYPFGNKGDNFIRLNYSYPSEEQILKGIPILMEVMSDCIVTAPT